MFIIKWFFCGLFFLHTTLSYADVGTDFVENGICPNELQTMEYLSLVSSFLPSNPNILEAGAHSGEDTILLASFWPNGHVFAFEPVPKFFDNLQVNVEKFRLTNVSCYPFGLFSTSGDHVFYYSQNCGGASSFLPDNGVVDYDDVAVILPCMNLDEWAHENHVDQIDFMWLDMEGAEYHVLSTAPETLRKTKVILTEINFREFRTGSTQYYTLKNLLESQGFVLHKIWGNPQWQATGLFIRPELLQN